MSLGFNLGIASALACLAMIEGECLAMIEGECLAMTKIFRNVVRGFSLDVGKAVGFLLSSEEGC